MVKKSNSPSSKRKDQPTKTNAGGTSSVVTHEPSASKGNQTMSDTSIIEYQDDLADAEAPPILPVGDYPAEIRGAEIKTSGKGNEYINVTFVITPENYPADFTDGPEEGIQLSYGRLSPANETRARYNMKKFVESIGGKLGKQLDLNDWIGLSANVALVHDTYEGETRAQIKRVNPA